MGNLIKAGAWFFAVVGVAITGGAGYVYVTNTELAGEFWAVKDEIRALPKERRQAVVAELPARITFERDVADDMSVLSEERRTELYEDLEESRAQVLERFKKRIAAEAEITRGLDEAKQGVKAVTEAIEQKLGDVNAGIDFDSAPGDALDDVIEAEEDVDAALSDYGSARLSADSGTRVGSAVDVLAALDTLGDRMTEAKQGGLSDRDRSRLGKIVTRAKSTLFTVKGTPGLEKHPEAQKLLRRVPAKLSSE